MNENEIITEFLIESNENLSRLDREIVDLERSPKDAALLSSIFRTIHTIKGTCGFLGFSTMELVSHHAETILSQLREGERELTPDLVSLVLQAVDMVKFELTSIEQTSAESGNSYPELTARLKAAAEACGAVAAPPPATPSSPAEETPSPAAPAETASRVVVAESTIRVDVELLDKLMNLVGELVLARNQVLQYSTRQEDSSFVATSHSLNLITTELQESVMKTRMQPIGVVWNKLPRVVRDLASTCGKQIDVEMDGAGTELDKTIIEAIKDPLTHIVRNSCDHGIEAPADRSRAGKPAAGKLILRAYHEGGRVNIEVTDDGGGINVERIRAKAVARGIIREDVAERMSERELQALIFHPGFSTATEVTNISGRGVGMDVVKTNVEKIGGTVDIASRRGEGTTIRIKIPLTLAIIPGLVVGLGEDRFVIPQTSLLELIRVDGEESQKQIQWVAGAPFYHRRGSLLPVAFLDQILDIGVPRDPDDPLNIVVLEAEDRQFGLVVDQIMDTQEIVVKPLGKHMKSLNCYAGATIMGDGHVALILDTLGVASRAGVLSGNRQSSRTPETSLRVAGSDDKHTVLLFRAGPHARLAVPLALVARLEEIPASRVELAAGRRVVQYRGKLLPLVDLGESFGATGAARDKIDVVVFADGERRIGLIVDEIIDIVEDSITIRRQSDQVGILGSVVLGGEVTDLLDVDHIIRSNAANWFALADAGGPQSVLIVDPSPFGRGLLRSSLEMAGYNLEEAHSSGQAVDECKRRRFDIVLASIEIGSAGLASLATALGPATLVAVAGGEDCAAPLPPVPDGFGAVISRFDRDGMLRSLGKLAAAAGSSAVRLEQTPHGAGK